MDATEAEKQKSDAGAIIAAVERLGEAKTVDVADDKLTAEVLVLPAGKTAQSVKKYLDEYRLEPERRKGAAYLTTLDSFIEHVNRFKDEDSAVFADTSTPNQPRLIGVLNYHRKAAGGPRFGDHRAVYAFPISDEWTAWTKAKDGMSLSDFAAFLEDHIWDVADPVKVKADSQTAKEAQQLGITLATPQALIELSRGISIKVNTGVTNAVKLSSGEAEVSFQEEHGATQGKGGKAITVPGGFAIDVPVFRFGEPYRLLVRLRYRMDANRIQWLFAISKVSKVFEAAIAGACKEAQEKTALPLFLGTPEV